MSQGLDEGLGLVLALAQALRDEFGVGIDAQPGGEGIEAGSVNRAFLAATAVILSHCVSGGGDLSHVLREVALRRLTELGVGHNRAEVVVSSEPRLGHRWLAYMALAPRTVIDDLIA